MRYIKHVWPGFLLFLITALIILGLTCNYPGVVIDQTRPVTEIYVFYPVYGVCTLFHSVICDSRCTIVSPNTSVFARYNREHWGECFLCMQHFEMQK